MQAKASGLTVCVSDRKGSFDHETFTLIHEFGHFFGAIDHYGSTYECPKTTQDMIDEYNLEFSEVCIYGGNKEELDEIKVCEGCRQLINNQFVSGTNVQ